MRMSSAERRGNLVWLAPIVALLGIILAARVIVGVAYADRIYPGVHVAGIDVGGQTVEQATATLQSRFAATNRPIQVRAGDVTLSLTPAQLGAHPQLVQMAAAAYQVGRGNGLLEDFVGPIVAPRTSAAVGGDALVDDSSLSRAVSEIAGQVDRAPRDAQLTFDPTTKLVPGVTGRTLDQVGTRDAIRGYLDAHLFQPADAPLVLPVATQQPAVTAEQLQPVQARADQLLAAPVAFSDGSQSWPIPEATVRAALFTTGTPPQLAVKTKSFQDLLAGVAKQIDRPAMDARVVISQGKVRIEDDQAGQQVDAEKTMSALQGKLVAGDGTIPITLDPLDALVKTDDLKPVAAQTQALLDKGLTLTIEDQPYQIGGSQLGDLVVIRSIGPGAWSASLDPAKVNALVAQIDEKFKRPTPDARFGWDNGKVVVLTPTVPGEAIDEKKAGSLILEKWQTGKVDLPVVQTTIKVDSALVNRLNQDLKGVIGERSISYEGSIPERAHNINLALSKINGTVVMPGQTFSFNRVVGPMTLGAGFQWGFAYSTGDNGQSEVVPSVAGGICEVATTMFQPVFWAGYEIDERHWHMFPMKSYADKGYMGLDATVSPEDGVDMQWKNNSDHAILIKAWGDGTETNVQLITTKPNWTVKVSPETITNITPAPSQPVRSTSPQFARGREIVLEVAQDGLTSYVTRNVVYPDGHVRTLKLASDYQPSPLSILVGTG